MNSAYIDSQALSVAPMMDWTDTHCRAFHRILAPHARLYTEMVHAQAVLHGDRARLLGHDASEHPLAQAIVAVMSPDDVRRAIMTEDVKALTRVPGIGQKGAQRIILELKDRIGPPTGGHHATSEAKPQEAWRLIEATCLESPITAIIWRRPSRAHKSISGRSSALPTPWPTASLSM